MQRYKFHPSSQRCTVGFEAIHTAAFTHNVTAMSLVDPLLSFPRHGIKWTHRSQLPTLKANETSEDPMSMSSGFGGNHYETAWRRANPDSPYMFDVQSDTYIAGEFFSTISNGESTLSAPVEKAGL
jgi:hypothetical protein